MPRPKRCRRIGVYPDFWSFAPEDAEEETEESVVLQLDELETGGRRRRNVLPRWACPARR